MTVDDAAAAYGEFFETLTPESLTALDRLCDSSVHFRDPFNDLCGVHAFQSVLAKMFEDVREPRFRIIDRACSGQVCYLRWDFSCRPGTNRSLWHIEGMSEVHFDRHGRVTAHLDHWDSGSQFFARLPLLGPLVRLVQRRVGAKPAP